MLNMKKISSVFLTYLIILTANSLLLPVAAFPEIGASLALVGRQPKSTSGWTEVSGWTELQPSDSGRFLFGAPLGTKASRFKIPKSGIYFVSFSIHLFQADIGVFQAALVINGQPVKYNRAMSATRQGYQGADFSLVVSGFVDLRSSDQVSVFVFAERDTEWSVEDGSQFCLRYTGAIGTFPAFSAIKSAGTVLYSSSASSSSSSSSSSHIVRNWETSGTPGIFISLSGFSPSTGEFIPICDGIYFLAANIRVEASLGIYRLSLLVNGKTHGPVIEISVTTPNDIFSMSYCGSFYFKRGDKIALSINSSTIHQNSGFSVSYIDAYNGSSLQGLSTITQTATEIPGTGWMELTTWSTPSISHVQFYNPDVFKNGRFRCSDGGTYFVAVSLRIRGGKGTFDLLVKSSGTSQLNGNAGLFATQYNPESSGVFSLSVSGLLELSKGQHVSVFVHSSFPNKWFIEPGSGLSVMKTRHYWPAANSYISSKHAFKGNMWQEIPNWRLSAKEGAFSFGTNFRPSSKRFTVSSPGIYFVSTNLLLRAKGNCISAVIAVNGKVKVGNGLFTTHEYPPDNLTLNIAGALNLQQGQTISVFVRSESSASFEILNRSGFSVVFIGKTFAVPGFHAVKGSQSVIATTNWVEVDEWEDPGNKDIETFENGDGFDSVRGIYTAPISGIYFVSCTLVTKDIDVSVSGSYIEMYIGVNRQASLTNGLQNTRYIQGTNPPSENEVMAITVSGMVRLRRGDYAVIRARTSMDSDWKVEHTSGFSIFLVSPLDIPYGNVGFLSRKSDTRIKSIGSGSWSKIEGWATQSDLTNGLFLKTDGSFEYEALSGDLLINHAGIYFISANVIVSSVPESCEVSILVSDSNGGSPEELVTGFSAMEQKPKSTGTQTLQLCGALFLKKNRKIHVAVRSSSAKAFTVWEGSGFSVARLIYPIEEPGFYSRADGALQVPGESNWWKITGWETSGESGLHIDGHGFNSMSGDFIAPLSGIYLASASVSFAEVSHATIVSVKISVNGDNSADSGLESSRLFTRRDSHAVVMTSGSMELRHTMKVSVMVKTDNSSSWTINGSYFTMRYISEREKTEGNMADRYSDVIFNSKGWKELVSWKTTGVNGQYQLGSVHQTTDRFRVSKKGVYFVTANIKFLETNGLVAIAIRINNGNDTAVVAKKSCVESELCVINIAAPVKLAAGTYVSVYAYSNDEDSWTISSQSSKSNLYLNPVPSTSVVQGFLAGISFNTSVGDRQTSHWFRVKNWTTTNHPGYFKTIPGFSDDIFVVSITGVYIIAVNLLLQCTAKSTECDFELLVMFNGRLSPSSGLYSRQTVLQLSIDTLNVMSVVHLYKWDTLAVAVRSDNPFQVLEDSTFSVIMHASVGGPFPCTNNGPALVSGLLPEFLRTRVGNSLTWSCEAVGQTPPEYRWLKNFKILSNVTINSLSIINATVQDSGDYACVAEISGVSVSSNVARLTVYDPRPAFESLHYTVAVKENGPAPQLILNVSVKAESKEKTHADMVLKIISGNINNSFVVQPNISLRSFGIFTVRPLDREDISKYHLLITATNIEEAALSSVTNVSIFVEDINDNHPHFDKKIFEANILENATLGHVVLILSAQDGDVGRNADISYSVHLGSGVDTFSLNKTSGEITLKKPLDRETQPSYSLFIAARDPDFSAYAEVIITVLDVNDHKPVFIPSKYNVTVSEAVGKGTSVLKLTATDKDAGTNSELVYSIVSGDSRSLFAVDNDGIITVARNLDHEKESTHNITITAHDKGQNPLFAEQPANVFIFISDLSDNSPAFEVSLYEETLSESTPPGTSVLLVRASDVDRTNNGMVFWIVQENLESDLKVNSSSGVIYVAKSLDFERTKLYRFQVAVREEKMESPTDFTTVVISISDENDNSPFFHSTYYNISVSEATPATTELLRLHASDKDSTTNAALCYFIESGDEDSHFFLDESKGFLSLTRKLDHENVSSYRLIINVTDKGKPPRKAQLPATVDIEVYDENDNAPRFDYETYSVSVYENITSGTFICTVHAHDKDSLWNHEVTYAMASYSEPNAKRKFDVNRKTGEIFTTGDLDREEQQVYEFTVVARDGGKVPFEGHAKVIVTLIDVNDNAPVFKQGDYQSTIQLAADAAVNSAVITMTAFDKDSGLRGKVAYAVLDIVGSILSEHDEALHCTGNLNGTFKIDHYTGTLRVARSLAARCLYNVKVRAMDHGIPPLSSVISVQIETGRRDTGELRAPTTISVISKEDQTKVIVIVCVFVLIIAVIIALVIWREGMRYMRKRKVIVRRSIRRNTKRTEDSSSSDDRETVHFTKYPTDQDSLYLDHCSTMTEMASSLLNQRSLCSSGMETDLLETFMVPYDEKDGYTVVDGDTESFCVSIDFGLESDDPFVFHTVDEAARKKSTRTQRGKSRSLVSSCGSKRSRASLPAKFGSRNYSKGNGVREVISDTRL